MTTEALALSRATLACALLLVGCPLPPPPAAQPIDCEAIDRAEERFPEECGDPDAAPEDDAQVAPSAGELEAGAQ
jgi:hypothetical protein